MLSCSCSVMATIFDVGLGVRCDGSDGEFDPIGIEGRGDRCGDGLVCRSCEDKDRCDRGRGGVRTMCFNDGEFGISISLIESATTFSTLNGETDASRTEVASDSDSAIEFLMILGTVLGPDVAEEKTFKMPN